MPITITDNEHKLEQALKLSIVLFADRIQRALNLGHMERKELDWWCAMQKDIEHIKALRRLLYQIEHQEAEPENKECAE